MNYSFKRYWEPSTGQLLIASLSVNAAASFISYPMEFIKTRIQVRANGIGIRNSNHWGGYNPFKIQREILAQGRGYSYLYHGFSTHLASRINYLTIRNVLYKKIYDAWKPFKPHNDLSHRQKAWIAGISGGLAALATTPLDLLNIR